ncbi:MAG: hypothetical protein RL001_2656 [Pseudomonadota bacterium]|jgi:hypothetical protein
MLDAHSWSANGQWPAPANCGIERCRAFQSDSGRAGATICYSVLNGHAGRVAVAASQAREAADVRQNE